VPNALSITAAGLCSLSAVLQLQAYGESGHPVHLGIAIFYLILLVLFLFRSPGKQAETRLAAWILALGGTYLPMLLQGQVESLPELLQHGLLALQCLALIGMIIGLSQLGKGFGVVPCLREIKTHGLYRYDNRVVRCTIDMEPLCVYTFCLPTSVQSRYGRKFATSA
jgi:uncharacterized membrane protein YfcA